ncbi:hypothetical protein KGQ24_03070 [Patescibacteria group bacterium]|nr:hypothetical protein [Patescibacteria group bacterium]
MLEVILSVLVVVFLLLTVRYWWKNERAEEIIIVRNQEVDRLKAERDSADIELHAKESGLAEISLRNWHLSQALLLVAKLSPGRPSLSAWDEEEHEKFHALFKQLGMKPNQLGFKSDEVYSLWRRDYYMRRARSELMTFRNREPGSALSGKLVLERLTVFFERSGYTQEVGLSTIKAKLEEFAPGAPPVRQLEQIELKPLPPAE